MVARSGIGTGAVSRTDAPRPRWGSKRVVRVTAGELRCGRWVQLLNRHHEDLSLAVTSNDAPLGFDAAAHR